MKVESNVHSKNMIKFAQENEDVLVLSADLGTSCEVKEFPKVLPEKYLSMGIAEQNMLSWAAGLAREGFRPFLHTFAVFLYRRPLDQLEMSIAYPNLPVSLLGFVPGITTPGGVTHQSIEDVGIMRTIPNMNIFDCGDATDVESVLQICKELNAPIYVRMLRGEMPRLFDPKQPTEFNKGRVISEGTDITLFSSSICTEEAMRATQWLKNKGISVQHVHITTLKPFTDPLVVESIKKAKYGVVTMENHTVIGGLGTAVGEVMLENQLNKKLVKVGIQDEWTHGASKPYLMKKYHLDAASLIKAVEQVLNQELNFNEDELEAIRLEDYDRV
ncbi:transketolase [Enterococcus sp. AZ194]|uniref:transketolase family protein n=1 Tax=Enterococcus sp. AZ194 TaxID=2774629 RepID=UPI003F20F4CE